MTSSRKSVSLLHVMVIFVTLDRGIDTIDEESIPTGGEVHFDDNPKYTALPNTHTDQVQFNNTEDTNSNVTIPSSPPDIRHVDIEKGDIREDNIITDDIRNGDIVKADIIKDDTRNSDIYKGDTSKDDTSKDDTRKDDIIKEDIIKEDIIKEDIRKDVIIDDGIIKSDIRNGDIHKGDIVKHDIIRQDIIKDDIHNSYIRNGDTRNGDIRNGDTRNGYTQNGNTRSDDIIKDIVKYDIVGLRHKRRASKVKYKYTSRFTQTRHIRSTNVGISTTTRDPSVGILSSDVSYVIWPDSSNLRSGGFCSSVSHNCTCVVYSVSGPSTGTCAGCHGCNCVTNGTISLVVCKCANPQEILRCDCDVSVLNCTDLDDATTQTMMTTTTKYQTHPTTTSTIDLLFERMHQMALGPALLGCVSLTALCYCMGKCCG